MLLAAAVIFLGWGPSRKLLETSYVVPQDISAYHNIRVQVGSTDKPFQVSSTGLFQVEGKDLGNLIQGANLPATTIRATASGIQFGTKTFNTSSIFVRSVNGPGIRFDKRVYKNGLEIKRKSGNQLLIINHIDLEHYLKGVVPFEANPKWTEATLEASAIVSRTFALFKMIEKRNQDFDVGSGVLSQVYAGENVRHDRTDQIIDRTKGVVLLYRGEIFPAYFHSASGGLTTGASDVWPVKYHPALQGVKCEFCQSSKHGNWSVFIKYADIEKVVREQGGLGVRAISEVKLKNYDRSGRPKEMEVIGRNGKFRPNFNEFRVWIGAEKLKSTMITRYLNQPEKQGVTFWGRGWGHGVGLDQYGAKYMGELGYTAQQILEYFYPGSAIKKIYE